MTVKGKHKGTVLYLDYIYGNILIVLLFTVLQDITFRGNWVEGTLHLSILFLTTVGESTIISNLRV